MVIHDLDDLGYVYFRKSPYISSGNDESQRGKNSLLMSNSGFPCHCLSLLVSFLPWDGSKHVGWGNSCLAGKLYSRYLNPILMYLGP